jgi:hypothetical protein
MRVTLGLQLTARLGRPLGAITVSFAAVPGQPIQVTSAQLYEAGSPLTSEATRWGFGWRGRWPPNPGGRHC